MTSNPPATNQKITPTLAPEEQVPRVIRSAVPLGKGYDEYREYLRYDFWYSCGYCLITEAEAMAVRFVIDHYEPKSIRRDLEHDYANLVYACDPCNTFKGHRSPPPEARAKGYRFFKPDEDVYAIHFTISGIRLEGKTPTGEFSIDALNLNRLNLRRLRGVRRQLADCDALVTEGIAALRHVPLDKYPQPVRGRILATVNRLNVAADQLATQIDDLLRENARSGMIDPDPAKEDEARARASRLKAYSALFPGIWHAAKGGKGQ